MKAKLLFCLELALSGVLFDHSNTALADAAGASPSAAAPQVYCNTNYGFRFDVPEGWAVKETYFDVAHYSLVFLTVNSQRPDLEIRDWPTGKNSLEFGSPATFQQMRPGEVYVSVGFSGGPMPDSMHRDTVDKNLLSLLATNKIHISSQAGLSCLDLYFFKRGRWWDISASLRDPVSEENRRRVMDLLQSFQFLDGPVSNPAWAESLAWKQLPQKIRDTDRWLGWPIVDLPDQHPQYGPRSVVVNKMGSTYSVRFILDAAGVWEYWVSADGNVESKPPVMSVVGDSSSQLPSDQPGDDKGKINVYWLAPFVQASKAFGRTTITWFAEDGLVERQATVSDTGPGSSFVFAGRNLVAGVNDDWKIALPSEPAAIQSGYDMSSHLASTPDSRVLVYGFHPKPRQVALKIYVHGKLANTVGPWPEYSAEQAELNDDGSAALLVAKADPLRSVPDSTSWSDKISLLEAMDARVIVLNTNGVIRFQTDCGHPVCSPNVAPDGSGVLMRPNSGGTNQNTFMWFTGEGKQRSLDLSPNPECLGWIPGSQLSLFSTSIGFESHYQLVDWGTGKRLWNVPAPGNGELMAIGLTPKLILFAMAEPYGPGTWHPADGHLRDSGKEWIRTFYALDAQNGSLVARWHSQFPHQSDGGKYDRFLWLNGKLFYLTADDFSEINLADVSSKKNDWR